MNIDIDERTTLYQFEDRSTEARVLITSNYRQGAAWKTVAGVYSAFANGRLHYVAALAVCHTEGEVADAALRFTEEGRAFAIAAGDWPYRCSCCGSLRSQHAAPMCGSCEVGHKDGCSGCMGRRLNGQVGR